MIKKVIKQSSNYFWGEAIIMASGFISFPILTRLFTKQQYGLMSLIAATIGIISSFAPLGANRSILRFYNKYKRIGQLNSFIGTLFISTTCCGALLVLLVMAVSYLLVSAGVISDEFLYLLPIALIGGIFQKLFIFLNTTNRMEEYVSAYNLFGSIRKYAAMIAAIGFVLIYNSLFAFYSAQLFTEIITITLLTFWVTKKTGNFMKFRPVNKIFNESILYGFPLAISAVGVMIFGFGDRYVIAYFLDTEHVAAYSVPYSLCQYFKELVVTCINLSLIPLSYKLWGEGNIEEIKRLLTQVLRLYGIIAIPTIFLLFFISEELITVVASAKYIESSSIMPVVMCGVMISFIFPFSAGLHFKKKTTTIMTITLLMAAVNIVLNFFLVPRYGIIGAAYSTLICGLALVFCFYFLSRKFLPFHVPFQDIGKYAILSGITYAIILLWSKIQHFDSDITRVFALSVPFIFVYGGLLLIFDSNVRLGVIKIKGFLHS